MRHPILALAALLGALQGLGCHDGLPPKPPPPAVHPAPDSVRSLAIHVHRLASPPDGPQDEWDYHHMSGLTRDLREAVVLQLARAGYTVIVDRRSPADVVAIVQATWPTHREGVATMTLSAGDVTVDQLSVEIPLLEDCPYDCHLEEHAAVALVEAMSRSKSLAAAARTGGAHARSSTPGAGGLHIAAPPAATAPSSQVAADEAAPDAGTGPSRSDGATPDLAH